MSASQMSMNLFKNVHPEFIIATFLRACGDEQFQNRWMTADTWVKLIDAYYKGNVKFNDKQLNRAIANSKSLVQQMDTNINNILIAYSIADNGGMFHKKYTPEKSTVWCYYASSKTQSPTPPPKGRKWFHELNDALDLLEKQV